MEAAHQTFSIRSALRIGAITGAGIGSGWLSGRTIVWAESQGFWHLHWPPGLIFGLLWLALAWIPGAMVSRERVKRSPAWMILLLAGITASYAMAFQTSYQAVAWLDRKSFVSISLSQATIAGGFLGGAMGSLGLVSLLALIFPAMDLWEIRAALIGWGAALGLCLGFWNLDDFEGLLFFFTIWQGGMAAGLALAGERGRNRRD